MKRTKYNDAGSIQYCCGMKNKIVLYKLMKGHGFNSYTNALKGPIINIYEQINKIEYKNVNSRVDSVVAQF